MRLRKWPSQGRNDLETYLFDHLRTMVLAQSILNPAVVLAYEDYRQIEKPYLLGNAPELQLVCYLVRLSEMASEARLLLGRGDEVQGLMPRIRELDQDLLSLQRLFRERLYGLDIATPTPSNTATTRYHAVYQMTYGSAMTLYSVLMCLHRALNAHDPTIAADEAQSSAEALKLARGARIYRPLGSLWVTRMLMVVWCATLDAETRLAIQYMIREYRVTQSLEAVGVVPRRDMEWMERRLAFRDEDILPT